MTLSWTRVADWTCLTGGGRNNPSAQFIKAIRNSSPTSSTIITGCTAPRRARQGRVEEALDGATVARQAIPAREDKVLTGATDRPEEAELPVPDHRAARERRREQHRGGQHTGDRKVRKSTSPLEAISDDRPVPSTNRNSTGWTSEETIRERRGRSGSSPAARPRRPPGPGGGGRWRAPARPPPASGWSRSSSSLPGPRRPSGSSGGRPRRRGWPAGVGQNTSSRLGRVTVTESIGTSRPANSWGTKAPPVHGEGHRPSWTAASRPNRSASSAMARRRRRRW